MQPKRRGRAALARALAGLAGLLWLAGAQAVQVLPDAVATLDLPRPTSPLGTPVSIGFDSGRFYGANTGSADEGLVWDAGDGSLLQAFGTASTEDGLGIEPRGIYFNPNTGALEIATFQADDNTNADRGLFAMSLDASGLFQDTDIDSDEFADRTLILAELPGLDGPNTMPAFDPALDRLYSRGTGDQDTTVNLVDRSDGSQIDADGSTAATDPLDLQFPAPDFPSGVPDLQGAFIGFDPLFDVLVTLERDTGPRAFVHDLGGTFLGASQLPAGVFNPTSNNFNAGYADGQLFVFDDTFTTGGAAGAYRGFHVLDMPEPGTLALAALGLVGLGVGRRRRR